MKLLILLSIIASGYGDKLDRTYLPPSSAGSAGGSPGALTAPGLSTFGVAPSLEQQSFGQPAGKNTFTQQSSQSTGPTGQQNPGSSFERKIPSFGSTLSVGKPSSVYLPVAGRTSQANNAFNSGFGSSAPSGSTINQPSYFGGSNVPSSGSSQEAPRNTFTSSGPSQQASSFNQANEQISSGFSPKSNQPERPQAAADRNAEILRYVNENDGDRFTYSFETSNGISAEESGVASGGVRVQGGYSYTGDDGKSYTITYTADEQGFVPQGEHLPTPHPIPEEILKSIEKNAQAAAAGTQEGAYRPEEYESEDNVPAYNSGVISSNKPQGQSQESNQKYSPSRTPASVGLGSQQAGSQGFVPNIPASQSGSIDTLNNALNQPSSFGGSVGSSNQGFAAQDNKVEQGFGPNNQVQSQIQGGSGYQYSRPQYTQYSSGPSSFNQTPGSQSRPQFGSQYRSSSQASTEVNQGQQGQFGSSSQASQASGVGSQYQPISSKSPSQPGSSGYQYQPASSTFSEPSTQGITALEGNQNQYQSGPPKQYSNQPTSNQAQYRPVSTQITSQNSFNRPNEQSSQNQPGLISTYSSPQGQNRSPSNQPGSGFSDDKGSAIQAPYQYKRPTQTLSSQSQNPLKPSFEKSTPSFTQGQGPVQQRYNQPTQSLNPSQSGFSGPIQGQAPAQPGFNQQAQGQGPSQSGFNRPIQGQGSTQPSFNQQAQGQGPSQSGFNRPIQSQAPAQPGFNQQTQGQGPSQSGFNRSIQGQAPAQLGFNQQAQGQGPSQSGFNRPIQSQAPAQPGFNQQTQGQRPSQSGFNRPIQGQAPAEPGINQQAQGQGPSQSGFNQPDQSLNVQEQNIKRPTKPDRFGGPRQPPSYNPQEGYKY